MHNCLCPCLCFSGTISSGRPETTAILLAVKSSPRRYMVNIRWTNKWIHLWNCYFWLRLICLRVKNSHMICYHEISPGSQWIQETLDEWVAEWSWPGSVEGRREQSASQSMEASQLRDSGHGEVLESWTGMSRGAEAPTAPKDQERKACGSWHHVGTKVVWRSHKGILESAVLMTCPEMKGLLMRW